MDSAVCILLATLCLAFGVAGQPPGDPFCFPPGRFTWDLCCDARWGPAGNEDCWDTQFSRSRCCSEDLLLGVAGAPGLRLALVDPEWQEDEFRRWDAHATRFQLKHFLQENIEWEQLRQVGHTAYLLSDIFRLSDSSEGVLRYVPSLDHLTPDEIKRGLFVTFFASDDDLYSVLDRIVLAGGQFKLVPFEPVSSDSALFRYNSKRTRYIWTDKSAYVAIKASVKWEEKWDKYHLNVDGFETICQILAATKRIVGAYVEIGVFKGTSANVALNYLREADIHRDVFLFDTFDGFSYDAAYSSAEKGWEGTHRITASPEEAMDALRDRLSLAKGPHTALNIGRFNALSRGPLPIGASGAVAAANVDVDLLDATEAALGHVASLMPVGGMIYCDDISSTPLTAGALVGFERFLSSSAGQCFVKLLLGTSWVLVRVAA